MSYIILDRDGVINYNSTEYVKTPDEWHAIPGSLEAIARLNRHGFRVLVVTNQSGVARGYYDIDTLNLIHEKMIAELASVGGYIEEIFLCPHHPDELCLCRKPQIGMLQEIEKKYTIQFPQTYFIGDSLTDVQVAEAMKCIPLLVRTGRGEETLEKYPEIAHVQHFRNLANATDYVLSREKKNGR